MRDIVLEPYNDKYYDFVYEVKKNAYKGYVENCWGEWDEEKQREYFKDFIKTYEKHSYIIQFNGQNIGFFNDCEIKNNCYEIGNICIIPQFQGQGIGSQILKTKLEEFKNYDIKIRF